MSDEREKALREASRRADVRDGRIAPAPPGRTLWGPERVTCQGGGPWSVVLEDSRAMYWDGCWKEAAEDRRAAILFAAFQAERARGEKMRARLPCCRCGELGEVAGLVRGPEGKLINGWRCNTHRSEVP